MRSTLLNPPRIAALSAIVLACIATGVGCKSTTVRGSEGQSVTATTPRSLTIRRGETTDLQVSIDRRNATGPVEVSISQLPKGVEADPSSMKVESTMATFVLKASSTAPIVEQQAVAVTVEDPDGREARHYVQLSVRP